MSGPPKHTYAWRAFVTRRSCCIICTSALAFCRHSLASLQTTHAIPESRSQAGTLCLRLGCSLQVHTPTEMHFIEEHTPSCFSTRSKVAPGIARLDDAPKASLSVYGSRQTHSGSVSSSVSFSSSSCYSTSPQSRAASPAAHRSGQRLSSQPCRRWLTECARAIQLQ